MNYNSNLIVKLSSKILSFACSPPAFCLREKRKEQTNRNSNATRAIFFFINQRVGLSLCRFEMNVNEHMPNKIGLDCSRYENHNSLEFKAVVYSNRFNDIYFEFSIDQFTCAQSSLTKSMGCLNVYIKEFVQVKVIVLLNHPIRS